jgi:hypothetical protein
MFSLIDAISSDGKSSDGKSSDNKNYRDAIDIRFRIYRVL